MINISPSRYKAVLNLRPTRATGVTGAIRVTWSLPGPVTQQSLLISSSDNNNKSLNSTLNIVKKSQENKLSQENIGGWGCQPKCVCFRPDLEVL